MANEYMVKIKTVIDKATLRQMEQDFNNRFKSVTRKFTKGMRKGLGKITSGLKTSLKGIGVAFASAILTNPIDEANEKLNETLDKYSRISKLAKTAGVSPAQYLRLSEVAGSLGVEDFQEPLVALLVKLGEARTGDDPLLKEFLSDKGIVETFKSLALTLKNTPAEERSSYVAKVFGESEVKNLAPLIDNASRLGSIEKNIFGDTPDEFLNQRVQYFNDLRNVQGIKEARRGQEDLFTKMLTINEGQLEKQDELARDQLKTDNDRLKSYSDIATIARGQEKFVQSQEITRGLLVQWADTIEKKLIAIDKTIRGKGDFLE